MKYGKFFANIYKTSRTNRAVIFKTSFFFKSIKENTNPKLFSESIEATFLREAETCIISLKFANDMNKLIISFYYFKELDFFKRIQFNIDYYAEDNKLPFFKTYPITKTYNDGIPHILKYFYELEVLLETKLMAKINDGTIDNHYYRIQDQYR